MTVEYSREGDVASIEMRRPDKRNALNTQMCRDILDGIRRAPEDGVRVVVISGTGPVFCAGADLGGDRFAADFIPTHTEMLRTICAVPIPVIAALGGPAIGGGCQLALAADLRIMVPEAYFEIPSTKIGIPVDPWTMRRAAALGGGGIARGLLLGGQRVGAERAHACGLANRLGDSTEAMRWAESIAQRAPLALQHAKEVLNDDYSDREPTDRLRALADTAWASEDLIEGYQAFREKRVPRFRGL